MPDMIGGVNVVQGQRKGIGQLWTPVVMTLVHQVSIATTLMLFASNALAARDRKGSDGQKA